MITRFRTRAFLIWFVPFAVLLAGSFLMIEESVGSTVRDGLRNSLRDNQLAIANLHSKGDLENSRFLKVAGENAALKAGMELLLSRQRDETARRTVEDQLRELGRHMGFDYLLVSAPDGTPMAGVVRLAGEDSSSRGRLAPIELGTFKRVAAGLMPLGGHTLQVASVPVDVNDENIGSLTVGEYFDFSEFVTPAVLIHNGMVIQSNVPRVPLKELDAALAGCKDQSECDLMLRGERWLSLPMQFYGEGYVLRSLGDIDLATAPIRARLERLFLSLAVVCLFFALLGSMAASQTIVKPIAAVVSHLRSAVRTGVLTELDAPQSQILEVRELTEIYNRAATSVKAAGKDLQDAYLEFIGSLANALDARDRYTSGHSWRVSQIACAIAAAMRLKPDEVERIRIGALLHDMGKIGIADSVLQKPGRLTEEEFAMVKEHPVIGRRILEGVQGLAPFLEAVELHHENWDGTGYPRGQAGEETPIDARIIHVSDAYDAMTTDRSYRRGMTHERAIEIIVENSGRQFDPRIVDVLLNMPQDILTGQPTSAAYPDEPEEAVLAVAV